MTSLCVHGRAWLRRVCCASPDACPVHVPRPPRPLTRFTHTHSSMMHTLTHAHTRRDRCLGIRRDAWAGPRSVSFRPLDPVCECASCPQQVAYNSVIQYAPYNAPPRACDAAGTAARGSLLRRCDDCMRRLRCSREPAGALRLVAAPGARRRRRPRHGLDKPALSPSHLRGHRHGQRLQPLVDRHAPAGRCADRGCAKRALQCVRLRRGSRVGAPGPDQPVGRRQADLLGRRLVRAHATPPHCHPPRARAVGCDDETHGPALAERLTRRCVGCGCAGAG